jgi:hypothetical protein
LNLKKIIFSKSQNIARENKVVFVGSNLWILMGCKVGVFTTHNQTPFFLLESKEQQES